MKSKSASTLLQSSVGVIALFLVLVAGNYLASFVKARIDLTADRSFTLSQGTREILGKLDTPVTIRLYVTQGENALPVFLKTYARQVEDLLEEYRQANPGNITIEKLDPQPDSDAGDSARLDGVEPQQMIGTGEAFTLGLSVSMLDRKEAIPFLSPDRVRQLEYDITRAIANVATAEKPVVGVMSPLPVAGMMNPMMMQMGGGREPWVFYSELSRGFKVRDVEVSADAIPDDIKVLVLIHPKTLSPAAEYAIDQFVLRGGKLIAFLDPLCVLDSQSGMGGMGAPPSNSTLDRLFKAWGVNFDVAQVVADITYAAQTRQGRQPAALALSEAAFDKDDIVTADANNALLAFAGAFSGTPADGLRMTPLIHTTDKAQLVDGTMARMSGEQIASQYRPDGKEYPLAIRLTGKFKTAFPEGKPAAAPDPGAPPEAEKKAAEPGLKESAQENTVVIFGDADMIQDAVAVDEMQNPFGGGRVVMPANGNLNLAQSTVEQMSGDDALIALRSRGVSSRPFTVVKEMQEQAESSYRSKIEELESSLRETGEKLSALQQSKDGGQKFILSPEQERELENFRQKEVAAKKQLKDVRRSLRTEIDSLETRIKWLNIAAVPAAVALTGLGLGIFKRQRAAAR